MCDAATQGATLDSHANAGIPAHPTAGKTTQGRIAYLSILVIARYGPSPALNCNRCVEPGMRIAKWAAGQLASPLLCADQAVLGCG